MMKELFNVCLILAWCVPPIFWKSQLFQYLVIGGQIWSYKYLIFGYLGISVTLKYLIDRFWKRKNLFWFLILSAAPSAMLLSLRWFLQGSFAVRGAMILFMIYSLILIAQVVFQVVGQRKRTHFRKIAIRRILGCMCLMVSLGGCFGKLETVFETDLLLGIENSSTVWSMEANMEYLKMWEDERLAKLTDKEKIELFQKFADLECTYLGIEPVHVEKEVFLNKNKRGSYNPEERILSISDQLLKVSSANAMETLLHECHHAYAWDLVLHLERNKELANSDFLLYRDVLEWRMGFERYVNGEEDYDAYYWNPVEIAARRHAKERSGIYLAFIDQERRKTKIGKEECGETMQ